MRIRKPSVSEIYDPRGTWNCKVVGRGDSDFIKYVDAGTLC